MTTNTTQVDLLEKKIEELEDQRAHIVTLLKNSTGSFRVNHMNLVSIEDELRRCRRYLMWIKGDES